jgi:integrase
VTREPTRVLTPQQARKCILCLRTEYPQALGWLVLTMLAGLRPEEAMRTGWKQISFRESWVRVEAQTTKVRQRRIVCPRVEAMALLKIARKCGAQLPISKECKREAIWKLRKALGFVVWPKDITRHTAASYWLAGGASSAQVAEMLGHSEGTLKRHYKALVTQAQAADFWNNIQGTANRSSAGATPRRRNIKTTKQDDSDSFRNARPAIAPDCAL